MYKGKKKFTRKQMVFVVEAAFCAVLDSLDSGLPDSISWDERCKVGGFCIPTTTPGSVVSLSSYERGVLESCGMFISIFFAQLTGEGMGASDSLRAAGNFDAAVEDLFIKAWADKGVAVQKIAKEATRKEMYPCWPDCHLHAELFVDVIKDAVNYPRP